MQKSKLRVTPEPAADAVLITKGPYKLIRHPMYTSLLLGSIGLLLTYFTYLRLVIFLLLMADLIIKLQYEELLLSKKFTVYHAYAAKSYKLFPFVY